MPQPSSALDAAIAVTRFGLGARPGEIDAVMADPRGWLDAQITPRGALNPADRDLGTTTSRLAEFRDYLETVRETRQDRRAEPGMADAPQAEAAAEARRQSVRDLNAETGQEFMARVRFGATTEAGFAERWALFWANLFTASATKQQSSVFVGTYEREAIRPHVFGQFADLAVAAEQHPAMLLYLDQAQSVGPNSPIGLRRDAGLNENLAREILELHTVGADGGYTQTDVTEFARALTGWTTPVGRFAQAQQRRQRGGVTVDGGFMFLPAIHEPGARTVMGQTYRQMGAAQGEAILRDLAQRPETARRLARRIASHFVADDPPAALVARLEQTWLQTQGDLAQVARALITAPETWGPQAGKFKTPYEFLISTHRALGQPPARPQQVRQALIAMGQPPFAAPSPEGWPDTVADWAGPDALVKRLNWAQAVADRTEAMDPSAVAVTSLGERLGERTRLAVARAESRAEAMTLLLMSPEFQRR